MSYDDEREHGNREALREELKRLEREWREQEAARERK